MIVIRRDATKQVQTLKRVMYFGGWIIITWYLTDMTVQKQHNYVLTLKQAIVYTLNMIFLLIIMKQR